MWKFRSRSGGPVEAGFDNPVPMGLSPDVRTGKNLTGSIGLPAAAGTARTITVPDWARGVKVYPIGNPCQFSMGETPVAFPATAVGTSALAFTVLGVGVRCQKDTWETRLLDEGTARVLHFISATASLVVEIEFF